MSEKLIYILPIVTIILFFYNKYLNGNNAKSSILFILFFLPLMNLKILKESYGGYTTFDFICFFSLIAYLKDFTTINLPSKNTLYLLLFILISIIFIIGGLKSEFPDNTYLKLIKIFPIFIFGRFFIKECQNDSSFHTKAINALKVSYTVSLAFLLIQTVIGLKFTFYPDLNNNTFDPAFNIIRYPGVFFDSQASGQFLAIGSFLILYHNDFTEKRIVIISYCLFIIAIIGIYLAGSRSAFGGFALGSLMVLLFAGRIYRIYGSILIIGGALFYIILSGMGSLQRNDNISEDYLFRQSIWKEAFEISKQHPWLGIGSGNYQQYIMRHAQDQYLEVKDGELLYFDQPENGYLKILVEFGFIGFGIFLMFFIIPFTKSLNLYINNAIDNKITFLLAALLCWMLAFNTVYSIADTRLLVMVVSLVVLIISYPSKDAKIKDLLNNSHS